MPLRKLPDKERIVGHEAGNFMSGVVVGWPEKEGNESLWMEGEEIINAFNQYREASDSGDLRTQAEAMRVLESFDTDETPDYARQQLQRGLDVIESAEAYERMIEEDYETEVGLDDVLRPFDWYDGIESDYEDVDIRGSEALRVVSSTIVKNWLDHGNGRDEEGSMWLEYEENGDEVELRIYDDGPGWPDDGIDFEESCQEEGIGLTTAYAITEEYGGTLEPFEPDTGGAGYSWTLEKA